MNGKSSAADGSGSYPTPSLASYITPRPVVAAAVSSLQPAAEIKAAQRSELHQERHDSR